MASSSTPFFGIREEDQSQMKQQQHSSISTSSAAPTTAPQKKKRNLPGTPNPDAEVIALSPKTLMATNRFICEVCNKGFQREQNLQLHRRGHNLPWKLKQKTTKEVKRKVYLCPEPTCVHHDPSRALGDLTGIKKHYSRKHGEKKYKCEKCSKKYAVQSDWKAHSKTCGTREYRCDCGTLFSRRDSFITHRAFCDALAQESARHPSGLSTIGSHLYGSSNHMSLGSGLSQISPLQDQNQNQNQNLVPSTNMLRLGPKYEHLVVPPSTAFFMPHSNQGYPQQISHDDELMPGDKPFNGLMQLPDLQGNTSNLFNLGFMNSANHNNSNLSSSGFLIPDQFNVAAASSGLSSLYSTNSVQHEKPALHMSLSATALLQKAAQLGPTTSTNNASLLKGLGISPSSSSFGGENLRSQMDNDQNQLQGLMNSLANGSSSLFGGGNQQDNSFGGSGIALEQQHDNTNFGNMDEAKLRQNYTVSIGGSDRLTLDFLGVGGGMVRNMGGGGFSQREQQHGINVSSLDPKMKSAQTGRVFGNPKLQ
uniref:Putative Indeterminate(ID)-domain 5 isoform 2 n=1 Tax=Davidia involucrata TaxID=16924 RepID=A0A5B7AU85_DAVIN